EAARHALAISNLAVSREREVVVVEVEDQPGVLADLTRRIARAGIDLDLVYVATRNRIVFGAPDLAGLRAALNCPGEPLGMRSASWYRQSQAPPGLSQRHQPFFVLMPRQMLRQNPGAPSSRRNSTVSVCTHSSASRPSSV